MLKIIVHGLSYSKKTFYSEKFKDFTQQNFATSKFILNLKNRNTSIPKQQFFEISNFRKELKGQSEDSLDIRKTRYTRDKLSSNYIQITPSNRNNNQIFKTKSFSNLEQRAKISFALFFFHPLPERDPSKRSRLHRWRRKGKASGKRGHSWAAAHVFRTPRAARDSTIFISARATCVRGRDARFLAPPRAPPISSFKIILRPKGRSPLSYPPRQITLAPARVQRLRWYRHRPSWNPGKTEPAEGEEAMRRDRKLLLVIYKPRLLLDLINNSRGKIQGRERESSFWSTSFNRAFIREKRYQWRIVVPLPYPGIVPASLVFLRRGTEKERRGRGDFNNARFKWTWKKEKQGSDISGDIRATL